MRIAQVSPLYESVPPRLYGGTERVVSYLEPLTKPPRGWIPACAGMITVRRAPVGGHLGFILYSLYPALLGDLN